MQNQDKRPSRRGWRQWSETEARAVLKAFAQSGQSVASFAKSRGVSARRLQYWTQRLAQTAPITFVPVSFPLPVAAPAMIEIALGDVVVRVREGLEVEHLARLVAALARRRTC